MSSLPFALTGLVVLLLTSAFFSAAEAALFSLEDRDRARAGVRVDRLLAQPRGALITLLLCNLLANVACFAFAAQIPTEGELAHVAVGFGVLIAVLVVGEILPKTLALRRPLEVARLCAWPVSLVVWLLAPVRVVFSALIELLVRALGPLAGEERGITTESLARVLESSASHGLLADSEAGLLAEVIELEGTRVREIMTPRVDMLALDLAADDTRARVETALELRQGWLPVIDGDPDEVIGCVRLRDVLLHPERPLRELTLPVKLVPEVASVLDLLRELRESRVSEAVVVDEWGGTAGVVTIEDIFEQIVGDLRVEDELREHPVQALGDGRFRVAGSLSVRDWNEQFGYRVVPTEFETVAGYVTALLGRIPRAGDRVRVGELVNEVHEVHGRRVISVDMHVESPARRERGRRVRAAEAAS